LTIDHFVGWLIVILCVVVWVLIFID